MAAGTRNRVLTLPPRGEPPRQNPALPKISPAKDVGVLVSHAYGQIGQHRLARRRTLAPNPGAPQPDPPAAGYGDRSRTSAADAADNKMGTSAARDGLARRLPETSNNFRSLWQQPG